MVQFANQANPFAVSGIHPGLTAADTPGGQQQGFNPTALLALSQGLQGFLQGGQQGGLGEALLSAGVGSLSGLAQGQQQQFQREDVLSQRQAQQRQQLIENALARRAEELERDKFVQGGQQFEQTLGAETKKEQRLLTKDQREAEDLVFKQNLAVENLGISRIKLAIDQANSIPERLQIIQSMGLDPSTGRGQEILERAMTKPLIEQNQPKLPPGQIPIDPNDLSKGTISAANIGTARTTAAKIDVNLQRYEEALREFGAETFPGPAKDKLKSTRTQLLFDLKTLNELGALQAPDLELMKDLLLDPTSITSRVGNAFGALAGHSLGDRALANIDVLRQQVSDSLNAITGQVGQPAGVPTPVSQAQIQGAAQDATDVQLLQSLGLQ